MSKLVDLYSNNSLVASGKIVNEDKNIIKLSDVIVNFSQLIGYDGSSKIKSDMIKPITKIANDAEFETKGFSWKDINITSTGCITEPIKISILQ